MKLMKRILFMVLIGLALGYTLSCSDDPDDEIIEDELTQGDDNGDNDDDGDNDGNDDDDDDYDDDDDDEEDEDEITRHPSLYFVRLDPDISEDEVEDLLDDLNSEEVWFREEINLRLWNTTAFPYTDAQSQQITNIDEQIRRARTRARLNDVAFNLGSFVQSPMASQNLFCFNDVNGLAPLGNNEVKISIFDSGINENALLAAGYALDGLSGYDYVEDDEDPNDENGHGTQITGLIYSLVGQGQSPTNITFDIRKTHDGQGSGFVSNLIPAILDAVNEGAQILNFSFSYQDVNGDTQNRPLRLAIDYAEANGALMVASAGNTNNNNDAANIISFPASYPNDAIISVASTTCDNKLSSFSSFGLNTVDLAFLGENIPTVALNGGEVSKSGTSYTTAMVSAMAAIMASQNGSTTAIKCSLITTSQFSDDLRNRLVSQGIVDFTSALSNMASCN
ncbi:MAG: S8 family serine peptidase [Bacteroidota bacterium]